MEDHVRFLRDLVLGALINNLTRNSKIFHVKLTRILSHYWVGILHDSLTIRS